MSGRFNERINILREQSRLLLAQVDENSKKVEDELRELYSSSKEHYGNNFGKASSSHNPYTASWKLRNDSSGVGGALYSEYFRNSPNQTHTSMPNIPAVKKIVISSKKHCDHHQTLESMYRKPVKECYCNTESKKIQLKSTRTQHKQHSTCKRSKSHANFTGVPLENKPKYPSLNSPISCETLRRARKIDYTPRSQFLCNVRSKISLLETATGRGDCPETFCRSQCYHKLIAGKSGYHTDSIPRMKTDDKTTQTSNDRLLRPASIGIQNTEQYLTSETESIGRSDKEVQVSIKRRPKSKKIVRRTVSSKTSAPDVRNTKSNTKVDLTNKTTASKEYQDDYEDKPEHSKNRHQRDYYIDSEEHPRTVHLNTLLDKNDERGRQYLSEKEMRELKKFREQNYFDTHGSSHTLSSSKSSGSVEQYLLNDRLFPEPVKRIHKKDLVVTMPPCATVQRKRIHYFPRSIIRQEKNNLNGCSKKKRCQSCPLTGHAIDLGITKIRPPLNSLALKYQKLLP